MYKRILVPIDGSPTSHAGLDEAIKLSKLTGARLRLLNVVEMLTFTSGLEPTSAYMADFLPAARQAGQQVLDQAVAHVMASAVPVDTVLLDGMGARVSDAIVEQARTWGADLIVIGTHGRRGVGRMLMGSDAEQVLRMAPVPVLLVRVAGSTPA
jgi:nucleotide-binding universal stress UspA family protein